MNELPLIEVPDSTWNTPLQGQNLHGETLAEVVSRGPTLLAFLRHFG